LREIVKGMMIFKKACWNRIELEIWNWLGKKRVWSSEEKMALVDPNRYWNRHLRYQK